MFFRPSSPPVVQVDAVDAQRRVSAGALLLDVREPAEWQAGHAPGALHVPLGAVAPASVPTGAPLVVVCRSGHRSDFAATLLASAGYDVVNLSGGMQAWQAAGYPVRRDSGADGSVI